MLTVSELVDDQMWTGLAARLHHFVDGEEAPGISGRREAGVRRRQISTPSESVLSGESGYVPVGFLAYSICSYSAARIEVALQPSHEIVSAGYVVRLRMFA